MNEETFIELMIKDDDVCTFLNRPKLPECRGLVFRGYRNVYHHEGKFEQRQGIKLLKKKSCSGCELCGSILDEAIDWIADDNLIFPKEIVNGGLYTIKFTGYGGSSSWYGEYEPDYDMEIVGIKE